TSLLANHWSVILQQQPYESIKTDLTIRNREFLHHANPNQVTPWYLPLTSSLGPSISDDQITTEPVPILAYRPTRNH
ncbi:hypothetical protein PSHT_10667, partial [Puccinia striiformis]